MRYSLNGNDWSMKEFVGMDWVWRGSVKPDTRDVHFWQPASVPGSVAADLMKNGSMKSPYYNCDSKLGEWISDRTWVYRKEFSAPHLEEKQRVFLCFEGIDYSGEIFLNGESLGTHTGMYLPWRMEITGRLKPGKNLVAAVLEPAPFEQPQVGKTSLVTTHKSRMTYWWDFCPRLIHQGLWDSVYLEVTGQGKIGELHLQQQLSGDFHTAVLSADVETDGGDAVLVTVNPGGISAFGKTENGKAKITAKIPHVNLWHPNGYGEPFLYRVTVQLLENGQVSDSRELSYGFRKIEFLENAGAPADAPHFRMNVNGQDVYINGWNWVPMDLCYGVEQPNRLNRLISLAQAANVTMFRVWGGGLIERETFYNACARAGILIWQELIQSSSGIDNKTSSDPAYIAEMDRQTEIVVKKRRNETALAVWCGGNELQDDNGVPLSDKDTMLSALKKRVTVLDPGRKWLPTSPSGGVFSNSMENIEKTPDRLYDVHGPWEHQGLAGHCRLYNRGTSLLHTEFGVEGMTNENVLRKYVSEDWIFPASKYNPVYFHRGAWWNNEQLVQKTFGGIDHLPELIRASQFMQYEGLKYAVECNRRRAFGNSGTFPWQFNEPFPNNFCTSALDYHANPKPVYYGVKKAYGALLISAQFDSPALNGSERLQFEWFLSAYPQSSKEKLTCTAALYTMEGRKVDGWEAAALPPRNGTVSLGQLEFSAYGAPLFLLRLQAVHPTKGILAENEYLFAAGDDLSAVKMLNVSRLSSVRKENVLTISNEGKTAALFGMLWDASPLPDPCDIEKTNWLTFSDNYFCLLPKEHRAVELAGDFTDQPLRFTGFGFDEEVGSLYFPAAF